jgi:integrase
LYSGQISLADGRRGFRFHDLRHSTASIMAARGERPEVIQRVMRHAKVAFTLDRYVKVFDPFIRAAVQRSDRARAG